MDQTLAALIVSDRRKEVNADAFLVYLIMRADVATNETATAKSMKFQGKLVCGLDVQSIALRADQPLLTVQRLIESLLRRQWIKQMVLPGKDSVYQLGDIVDFTAEWFVSAKPKEVEEESSAVSSLRKRLLESKARLDAKKGTGVALSREAKIKMAREVIDMTPRKKPSVEIVELFRRRYFKLFGEGYPLTTDTERKLMYTFAGRLLSCCDNDLSQAQNIVNFVYDNWEKIKTALRWEGRPTFSMIGTVSVIKSLKSFIVTGIPDRAPVSAGDKVAKRYDKDAAEEAPDVGF